MNDSPKITSVAPWFGGKRSLAPKIVELLGEHRQYFEPFVGGISILFAKPKAQQETVNDLHGELTNLARVLQGDQCPELYDRLTRVISGDHVLEEARSRRVDYRYLSDIDRAYWYFVESWMARNGLSGMRRSKQAGFQLAVRWTPGGGSSTTRFRSAVESIPAWHDRLRNVLILNRDAFEIIPKFADTEHTAIYVDPPYFHSSRSGISSGCTYEHDFEATDNEDDSEKHAKLAKLLRRFERATVVVSYYDCGRVRELYSGWRFIDCARQKNLHMQNKRGAVKQSAPEVLITNR